MSSPGSSEDGSVLLDRDEGLTHPALRRRRGEARRFAGRPDARRSSSVTTRLSSSAIKCGPTPRKVLTSSR